MTAIPTSRRRQQTATWSEGALLRTRKMPSSNAGQISSVATVQVHSTSRQDGWGLTVGPWSASAHNTTFIVESHGAQHKIYILPNKRIDPRRAATMLSMVNTRNGCRKCPCDPLFNDMNCGLALRDTPLFQSLWLCLLGYEIVSRTLYTGAVNSSKSSSPVADRNVIAAYAQQSLQWHTLELPINAVLLLPTYLTRLISDTYTREYTLTMQPVPQQRSKRSAPKAISIDPLNITLGVELEFMILESYNKGQRPTRENNDATLYSFDLVSEALSKPVQLTCSSCGDAHDFDPPLNLESKERIGSAPACWSLVSDKSIELKHRQKAKLRLNDCDVYGVEVTSRVLSGNLARQVAESSANSNHTHTISYQDEITGILNTLSKALDTRLSGRQGRRLVTNDSCSLHVHVGNSSNGFPLQTVKNLLSICTAFERVIDGMHAASRIGGSVLALTPLDESSESEASNDMVGDGSMFNGIYNKALTEHLMSNAYVTRRNDTDTPQLKAARVHYPANQMDSEDTLKKAASGFHTMAFFEVIQQAPDIESLQEMLLLSSKTNVNIMHLVVIPGQVVSEERPYARFNTIEFRQHAAIAEPREALAWIDFVQTLVKYAHDLDEKSVRAVCEHVASNPALQPRSHVHNAARQTANTRLLPESYQGGSRDCHQQLSHRSRAIWRRGPSAGNCAGAPRRTCEGSRS